MKDRLVKLLKIILAVSVLISSPQRLDARFVKEDADLIDQEERQSLEVYNDRISYYVPSYWSILWEAARNGLMINAGSLLANRFDYFEAIKVSSDFEANDNVIFSYKLTRTEDLVESRFLSQARLSFKTLGPLYLFITGDGGSYKEYGDLGFGISYRLGGEYFVRIFYCSVDHYFNEKKDKLEGDDKVKRDTNSMGLEGLVRLKPGYSLEFKYERDSPLSWHRYSKGYLYDYSAELLRFQLHGRYSPEFRLFLKGFYRQKSEGKTSLKTATLNQRKSLWRRVETLELGVIHQKGHLEFDTVGFVAIKRTAQYAYENFHWPDPNDPTASDYPERNFEPSGPNSSKRQEFALYLNRYFPFSKNLRHRFQYGIIINDVYLNEYNRRKNTEIKIQTSFDYQIDKNIHVFSNITWDIDQMGSDIASDSTKKVRPWGGGNIQFLAYF